MLSQKLQDAINDQINYEFVSAYVYLAMSTHFETTNLPGCASWMRQQAQEEIAHAMKLYEYVHDRDGVVILKSIAEPPREFGSSRDTFQTALEHEQGVTARINKIYALAMEENDFATQTHLQWFITEQIEEEKTASDIIAMFDLAGKDPSAILTIDDRLGQRVVAAAAMQSGAV